MNENNKQIIKIIKEIADSKEISTDNVILALQEAMKKAYEREFSEEICEVKIDKETGKITFCKLFTIVANDNIDYNEYCQIPLNQIPPSNIHYEIGQIYRKNIDFWSLERRVVLHMLQVFKHDISSESNKTVYKEWLPKKGSIILAEVEKVDKKTKMALVNLGKTYGIVPKAETNPQEQLIPGKKYKFVIRDVLMQTKGWPIILSRIDGELVKDLLSINIPEIQSGIVEIVKVGRAVGFKTKVAVKTNQPGINPIGACVGAKADRIKAIQKEMGEEKIEFVTYYEEIEKYLVEACRPAPLYGYKVIPAVYETDENNQQKEKERKKIILVVDEHKLPLLIGLKGKNVHLLSQLLDANLDVRSIEEANEEKINYTKVTSSHWSEFAGRKTSVNKFSATYDKCWNSDDDIINEIDDKMNKITNETTKLTNQTEKNEENIKK